MTYTVTITNSITGASTLIHEAISYIPAYRIFTLWAEDLEFDVNGIYGENMLLATAADTEYLLKMEMNA